MYCTRNNFHVCGQRKQEMLQYANSHYKIVAVICKLPINVGDTIGYNRLK